MGAVVTLFMLPIIVLNLLGGIVGGVWLMISGDWSTFLYGLAYLFGGSFLLSLLLAPGLLLFAPSALLSESRQKLALVLGIPSLLWTYGVVTLSCVYVFSWIMTRTEGSPIPYLLWAYAVSTGPWTFMASREAQSGGGDYANLTTFAAQLGVLSLFVAYLTDPTDLTVGRLIWWFAPLMIVAATISMLLVWANVRAAQRYRAWDDY